MKIRSRKSWSSDRDPRPMTRQLRANVREFFLHWPADKRASLAFLDTVGEQITYLRGIRDFHMDAPDRRYSFIGYSFAVFQNGAVYRLRGMGFVPAGQLRHNTNTVAVLCVVGASESPSPAMKSSLKSLKRHVDRNAGRTTNARGHGEVTGTDCPGPRVRAIIPTLEG
jgi:hypothetical protein